MLALPIIKGFFIAAGLIIPLGAQNSYVMTLGIKRNHHFTSATICFLCDFILMSIGVLGGAALFSSNETLLLAVTWGGIVFLSVYGILFFRSFLKPENQDSDVVVKVKSRSAIIAATLAVTLLNPHVYLDTIVLIGSIAGQYSEIEKYGFLIGCILASASWFYTLSFAASRMSPLLSKPKVQRYINLSVSLIMWAIALSLLLQIINK